MVPSGTSDKKKSGELDEMLLVTSGACHVRVRVLATYSLLRPTVHMDMYACSPAQWYHTVKKCIFTYCDKYTYFILCSLYV